MSDPSRGFENEHYYTAQFRNCSAVSTLFPIQIRQTSDGQIFIMLNQMRTT